MLSASSACVQPKASSLVLGSNNEKTDPSHMASQLLRSTAKDLGTNTHQATALDRRMKRGGQHDRSESSSDSRVLLGSPGAVLSMAPAVAAGTIGFDLAHCSQCVRVRAYGGGVEYNREGVLSMEHFEDAKPLTADEIDDLCEDINLQPVEPIELVRDVEKLAKRFDKTADGDSGDAEHDAAYELRNAAMELAQAVRRQKGR
jgi:hypothetical protein